MPRLGRLQSPLCCHLSVDERIVVDELKGVSGLPNDNNLVLLALWHLAKHYNVPLGPKVFALRTHKAYAKRRSA